MTDRPTTPTGKRLWDGSIDTSARLGSRLIIDIEQQAAAAARADANRLAAELRECANEMHVSGNVRDHWTDPKTNKWGDKPVDFAVCVDRSCEEAREALRLHDEAIR